MLVASALCWRRAFRACGGVVGAGRRLQTVRRRDVPQRRTPARAGGTVRIRLFARSLDGDHTVQRSAVALLGIGCVRGGLAFYVAEGAAGVAFGVVMTGAFILGRADRDVPVPVW